MNLPVATLFAYLSLVLGQNLADDPMITAAPILPTPEDLEQPQMALLQRAAVTSSSLSLDDYLNYCYGAPENEGICEQTNILSNPCLQYLAEVPDTKYWQCVCPNGYVAANLECHWCALAFDQPDVYDGALETSACSSVGVSIAPIPSSVLASYSAWNASYTGYVPGRTSGSAKQSGGSASPTSTTIVTSASNSGSANTLETSQNFFGLSGTETLVRTANGGGAAQTTASSLMTNSETAQASSTNTAKAGSAGAQSWDSGVAAVFSVVVFSLAVFCML